MGEAAWWKGKICDSVEGWKNVGRGGGGGGGGRAVESDDWSVSSGLPGPKGWRRSRCRDRTSGRGWVYSAGCEKIVLSFDFS